MSISRRSKSILEEINTFVPKKNKEDIIESRAQHILVSAINLLESLDETFTPAEVEVLRKKFISSIRGSDPNRFTKTVKRIKSGCDIGDDIDG